MIYMTPLSELYKQILTVTSQCLLPVPAQALLGPLLGLDLG